MYKVVYSNQAQVDLEELIDYIAQESRSNALKYLSKYEKKVELLMLNPLMGVECKTKLIKRDCRVLVQESHIIIYKVNSSTKEIFVVRIFHTAEEYVEKLNGNTNG